MRTILIFIGIIFGTMFLNAQNATIDRTLDYTETYLWYDGISTDVLDDNDSTWMYTVRKKTDAQLYCYVDGQIDYTGGTADSVWVYLQNKHFPDQSYTTIDSKAWAGSGTFTFTFTPSVQTFTIASHTLTALTDTAGLENYPADSIVTVVPVQTLTTVPGNQDTAGEYWRVLISGDSNSLDADIKRLNFKFLTK